MDKVQQWGKNKALGLFLKEGIFHAVIEFPRAGFSMEVALHGAATLEEAMQAISNLVQPALAMR